MSRGFRWLRHAGVALLVALVACGGGGGGGGTPDASTAVTVTLLSPTQPYTATVPSRRSTPDLTLVGQASGDLSTLNGRTLWVIVEDAAGLFDPQAFTSVDARTGTATIRLFGKQLTVAGHFTGTLRVLVCLDATCQSQLKGSPLTLPYDVTVLPGLAVSTHAVAVTARFGDQPPQGALTLALPPNASAPSLIALTLSGPAPGNFFSASSAFSGPDTATVTLDFVRGVPGVYNGHLGVLVDGYSEQVGVTLTVQDDPTLVAAVWPRSFEFTQAAVDTTQHAIAYDLLVRPGDTPQYLGIVYLESPPASAGHPQRDHWLFQDVAANRLFTLSCGTAPTPDCLPAGTYRAAARWQIRRTDGSVAGFEVPITLILTP